MKVKVNEITEIQIGYQSRERIESDQDGTHRIIQIKDFDNYRHLQTKSLTSFFPERAPDRYLVNQGDILFLSRGQRNFAYALDEILPDTVAASYFFILRVKNKDILSDYLAWYINQVPAQEFLYSTAKRGSHMPIVPKASFELLEVSIPPIDIQKTIVKIEELVRQEQDISEEMAFKRELLIRTICLKKIAEQS